MNRFLLLLTSLFLLCSCEPQNILRDIDGNTYRTVQIGTQTWMAENLRVTRYRNGNPVLHTPAAPDWSRIAEGAWCSYQNDTNVQKIDGNLYNWYAVNDPRGLAPEGWHIPSAAEIATLVIYLKGDTLAGSRLKERGTTHWLSQNSATGDSGFNALPGGYRSNEGSFYTRKSNGYWWEATRSFELFDWSPRLFETFADVDRDKGYMNYGLAVRCIKD